MTRTLRLSSGCLIGVTRDRSSMKTAGGGMREKTKARDARCSVVACAVAALPLMAGCRIPETRSESAQAKAVVDSSVVRVPDMQVDSGSIDGLDIECVAGDPEAKFGPDDSGVVESVFQPLSPRGSLETALLANGDSLRIENHSCEYWVEEFTFQTRSPVGSCPALGEFLRTRIAFLSQAKKHDPLANQAAIRALVGQFPAACDSSFQKPVEFSFGNPEMQTTFSMDDSAMREIGRATRDGFQPATVRFTLSIGPI